MRSGFFCTDERVGNSKCIQEAALRSLHLTHPGSSGVTSLSQYVFGNFQ